MTRAEIIAEFDNSVEGDLNEIDCIECNKCLNRGYITIPIDDVHTNIVDCECKKKRDTYISLRNCGITMNELNRFTFDNFNIEKKWHKTLVDYCKEYLQELSNGNDYWFILSGQSGSGKTHLCTAIFQEAIKTKSCRGLYMMWNTEIPNLCNLRRSFNDEEYREQIKIYKDVSILYIDDLFKLDGRLKEDSLSIAYEILNYRYLKNKITIISTETTKDQFKLLDIAISGRCAEKCGKYWFDIKGENTNYRFKGEL